MKRKVIVPILAILFVVAVATFFLFTEKETINNNPTPVPTEAPIEVPTVEPTKEPTVTPTEVPVIEPTTAPTEAPVEVPTETPGCEHKEVVTFLAEETMEEYKYQEICSACNEVVKEYTVTKEPVPTVTPTSTPTPLPTSTPTPAPTSTPTPTPKVECKHEETGIAMVDETDTEYVYRETCDACGAVLDEFTKPKATPTPTPKPTDKPVPTATPVPDKVVVKEEELKYSTRITYADRTVASIFNDEYLENYLSFLPSKATPLSYVAHYEDINTLVSEEIIARYEEELGGTTVICYFYYYYDAKTDTWTSRFVNSDGSFNKYSGKIIDGKAQLIAVGSPKGTFRVEFAKSTFADTCLEIYVDDFIYYEDDVVQLFDY